MKLPWVGINHMELRCISGADLARRQVLGADGLRVLNREVHIALLYILGL